MGEIRKARYLASKKFPYLSTALLSMQMIYKKDVPTMGVDYKWRCYYGDAVNDWSNEQVATVLVHEVWHLLRDHPNRRHSREPNIWNVAVDEEINDDINEPDGSSDDFANWKIEFPFPPIYPSSYNHENNKLGEEYYEKLLDQIDKGEVKVKPVPYGGSAGDGISRQWEYGDAKEDEEGNDIGGISDAESQNIRRQTAENIRQYKKQKGNIPNNLEMWADSILTKPKVDWKKELKAQLRGTLSKGKEDYSYARINNRRSTAEVILPGNIKYEPSIAVTCDSSGSMSDEGSKVLSEVDAILKQFDDVKVISADTEIHNIQKVNRVEDVVIRGMGGTSMKQAIEQTDELKPDLILCITDGITDWPDSPTRAKLITVITDENSQGPAFGKVIYV